MTGWTRTLLSALIGITAALPLAAEPPAQKPVQISTAQLALQYFTDSEWSKLDQLVDDRVASDARADDGRPQIFLIVAAIDGWLEQWGDTYDESERELISEYLRARPQSALAPMLNAMRVHGAAWRARGHGFSSTVTPEGWNLFAERNKEAWALIQAAKERSSRLPAWYAQAIGIAEDVDAPANEIKSLLKEGIRRFPGYFPLYFSYARQFAPRWGGSYPSADRFITAQVAARTNPDGDALYTRLYWLIDQYNGGRPEFFRESLVDWPRMRAGFEQLMKQFPNSTWNQANFVAYACRASDADTYFKWRRTVDVDQFRAAAPEGVSLEVCDARFTLKT